MDGRGARHERARGSSTLTRCIDWFDAIEIGVIRRRAAASSPPLRRLSIAMNWLANGWLYAAFGLLFPVYGRAAARPLAEAGLAAAIAFSPYPFIKRLVARHRPFVRYADVRCERAPRDRYSFPSGHSMAAGAVFVPLALSFPELTVGLAPLAVLIAWARLADGHHYPSDVVAGLAIGAVIALAVRALLR